MLSYLFTETNNIQCFSVELNSYYTYSCYQQLVNKQKRISKIFIIQYTNFKSVLHFNFSLLKQFHDKYYIAHLKDSHIHTEEHTTAYLHTSRLILTGCVRGSSGLDAECIKFRVIPCRYVGSLKV